jgi:hypothetical protein
MKIKEAKTGAKQNLKKFKMYTSLSKVAVKTEAARPGIRTIGRQEGEHDGGGGGGAATVDGTQSMGMSKRRMTDCEGSEDCMM